MKISLQLSVLVAALLVAPLFGQTTHYVDDDNACPGAGSQVDPFCTIGAGISAAITGDEVLVAEGNYNERVGVRRGITLRSTDPNDPAVVAATIIDGTGLGGSVITSFSNAGADSVLEGFTITGGIADRGGGLNIIEGDSPTVRNCIFSGNFARIAGGGMYNNGGRPTVTGCTFIGNSATDFNPDLDDGGGWGGGMYNVAIYGGGNMTVTNCTFSGNSARFGGGMYNASSNSVVVANSTFSGNSARFGGGMYNDDSVPSMINGTFSGNSADKLGGAIYNFDSTPRLTNCILWGDTPDEFFNSGSSMISVFYSCIQDGSANDGVVFPGVGNIDADPLFIGIPGTENLRLQAGSPGIDSADSFAYGLNLPVDLDGNPRGVDDPGTIDTGVSVFGLSIDMGAFEFQDVQANADLDHDGDVDLEDVALLFLLFTGPS